MTLTNKNILCCVQCRRNELESGGTGPAQSAGKFFRGRAPPFFGSKSTVSRFGERFRDGQYCTNGGKQQYHRMPICMTKMNKNIL